MSLLVRLLLMIRVEEMKGEETKKRELPAHVKTFDPENPPYQTLRLCIYMRELEEEKEEEESNKTAEPIFHK